MFYSEPRPKQDKRSVSYGGYEEQKLFDMESSPMEHHGYNYSQPIKTFIRKSYYESKQYYKNEKRILCEKIKYIGDLIEDLMDDDPEGKIQNKYLQSEIEKHILDLLNPIGLLAPHRRSSSPVHL